MQTASSYGGSYSGGYSGNFSLGSGGLSLTGAGNYGSLFGQSSLSGYGTFAQNSLNTGSYYLGNTSTSLQGAMGLNAAGGPQTSGTIATAGGISTSTTVLIFLGVAVAGALVAAGLER